MGTTTGCIFAGSPKENKASRFSRSMAGGALGMGTGQAGGALVFGANCSTLGGVELVPATGTMLEGAELALATGALSVCAAALVFSGVVLGTATPVLAATTLVWAGVEDTALLDSRFGLVEAEGTGETRRINIPFLQFLHTLSPWV